MGFKTTCPYCGVGCGIIVEKDPKGKLSVKGDVDHPANKGMLCSKGRNLHYVAQDISDRILYPQMRLSKNHPLERVTWEKAIYRAVKVFSAFIEKFGPDSVGFYVSGQCLTEEYYLANKLCKGYIGTNNIDTNSRLCMSSAVVGYKKALGEDAVPVSYDDIEQADCFFITGANPAWCHPILFRRLEQHKKNNPDIKIIVADPRRTQSCEIADIHLQINPGTDVHLNNAICKYLIDNELIDHDFINKHTNGFDDLKKSLEGIEMQAIADICGIDLNDIVNTAKYIGYSKGLITMWAMGLNQSVVGVDKNVSLINISLITGKIGKPGNGPFSLTGQPNAMGGREVGGMCNLLPAHRDLSNPAHREEVAAFWNVSHISEKPGYSATEMFEKLAEDKLKAIWIICTNPLVSMPNVRLVEKALSKARFVIVQDISNNSITCEYADIVLPAAGWLEKEGTMTNSDRRISYLSKVINSPGEAKPDSEILISFAREMGYQGFGFNNAEDVFNEHKQLTKGTNIDISGLTYEYLKNIGPAQWPFNDAERKETKRLFTDFRFYTPDQRARINTITLLAPELLDDTYPLIMTTGRIRDQWHTMTKTGKVQRLNQHIGAPYAEMHPDDARHRGISENDTAVVIGAKGDVRVSVKITDTIKKGVVFLPIHWGKIFRDDSGRANNITTGKVDPVSKEPDFKFTLVEVKKYVKPKETFVVIGAGAASYKFIETFRELNKTDEILVFTDEKEAFYNRILLPEYIDGSRDFNELRKIQSDEVEKWNVILHCENRITEINHDTNTITDSFGKVYSYSKLILCTGSSPRIPGNINIKIPGVFALRNKKDADYILDYLKAINDQEILIVGGGLLGLETAAALHHLRKSITIVHRNSRLMDKQLDYVSSNLLSEQILGIGIRLLFNDEIDEIQPAENSKIKVLYKSGKKHFYNSVIFAIGTQPNIDLAKKAGILTNKAVIINERLETSKKNIYAIGEIAEINGQIYGITTAAEEQADVLARSLAGDPNIVYTGSVSMNILKFPGIDLCSIGVVKAPEHKDGNYEEIVFSDISMYYYKKCILKDDRMIGAVLMGDKSEFSSFKGLIQGKQELAEMRKTLLRNGNPIVPIKGKIVCSCNNVGKGNIEDEIDKGSIRLDEICEKTNAGTGCGSCVPEIKQMISKMKVEMVLP